MTIIVLELDHVDQEMLLNDARLETIQFLLSQGCYGELKNQAGVAGLATLWDILSPHIGGAQRITITDVAGLEGALAGAVDTIKEGITRYLHIQAARPVTPGDMVAFDTALAALLPELGQDGTCALLGVAPAAGVYVVVAGANPLQGQARPATTSDIALTLLALAGRPRPDELPGEALFSALDEAEIDEDAELRERFRGLGYIA